MIMQALKIKAGSKTPSTNVVGTLTKEQVREIAQEKLPDLNTKDLEMAMNTVMGTARSMGVEIK